MTIIRHFDIVCLMYRIIASVLLFTVFFAIPDGYGFWIWSPKTKKWKESRLSLAVTPKQQLDKGVNKFQAKDYVEARKEFEKILKHYPDAFEASEAQYFIGRCLHEQGKPYQAFLEYQKVVDTYPNSSRIQEVIEQEYNIGEFFLTREPKKWMGISFYDLVEHPSLEIFAKVVENAPYSEYAPRAQYKLGVLYSSLGRYSEANEAFQKLIDNYPQSEWAEAGKYQLAASGVKASAGVAYDDSFRKEAMERFEDFVENHPEAELSEKASEHLTNLREEEAGKNYDIAVFYEKNGKLESALIYYKFVIDSFYDTSYSKQAKEGLNRVLEKTGSGNETNK